MSRLTPIKRKELIARLRKMGFEGPFSGGKHEFMVRNNTRFTLPNPHKGEIGPEFLKRLLKQAGILDEWEEAGVA